MELSRAFVAAVFALALVTPPAHADVDAIVLDGVLAASRQATVKARVEGPILGPWVRPGDAVRRDQVLGRVACQRLDDEVRHMEERDAEAIATVRGRRAGALAALERASARRAAQEAALEKVKAFHDLAARVIVMRGLRAAQAEETARKRDLAALDRQLELGAVHGAARAARDRVRALEEVRAPFDALVVAVGTAAGMRVGPAGPGIATLAQIDPVVLYAPVPPGAFRYVPEQGTAKVQVDELPDRPFTATIAAIDVVYGRDKRQLGVTLELANGRGLLRPGMHAHATLPLADLPQRSP